MPGKLIIICGLPGAGKTTHAKALEQSLGAVRFCADEWMDVLKLNLWDESARAKVESLQWIVAQRLLTIGQTVLIEWGTWSRSERDTLRTTARVMGASVELHYLSAPMDILRKRLQQRQMEQPPITRQHLEDWTKAFEPPTAEEAGLFDRFWRNNANDK
jgi:predicted kinase